MKKMSNSQMANNWGGQYDIRSLTEVIICVADIMQLSETDFETAVQLCALSEAYPIT